VYPELEIINHPFREFKVDSVITFTDGTTNKTDCIIKIFRNGKIRGEFELNNFNPSLERSDNFKLNGIYQYFQVVSNDNVIIRKEVSRNPTRYKVYFLLMMLLSIQLK
jgi:hypothetical protein